MYMKTSLTRRDFITRLSAAAATLPLAPSLWAADSPGEYPIIAFSKAFQHLNYEDTADLVADVGWSGIECTVRKGGHVVPERVEDDLPKMVEALKKRGRAVTMMATDILTADEPLTGRGLRTAAKLGIRYYRLKGQAYRADQTLPAQIQQRKTELRDLAAFSRELGVCGGFQNHSGSNLIGAPVWDIYELIKDLDPRAMGICFDIGHATIEGGYAWPLHARLMAPFFAVVYVKDFLWQKVRNNWEAAWCPLGDGMINRSFFKFLKQTSFRGPISQHHEYEIGRGKAMVTAMKKDLQTLQSWLKD
jgi:sugar phosphate isomerase/epimerase